MRSLFDYRLRKMKRTMLAKLVLLAPKLSRLLKTPTPLARMEYRGGKKSRTLIIFLPGISDMAEDFERRGFIDDMRRHGIAADAVAVDAHYGYYATRVIHERITDDVISWAHAAGYRNIWLAGVSLGGFGAVSYASRHPSQITGLLLFAPYLGGAAVIREIADAGGVHHWEPGAVEEGDYQRALWSWFKHHFANHKPALQVYLGFGTRDMFARANALLADILPRDSVFSIPGGHDWRTWKRIWHLFLGQRKSFLH
jgi:pimeloyl-ACP methyl ester carboxylesterase